MPQVELKYTNNIELDCRLIFSVIEETINNFDSKAGACKSRAYPCRSYLHDHVFVSIKIIPKPYRDNIFCKTLLTKLNQQLSQRLTGDYFYSLLLEFTSDFYITK